MCIRDRRQHNTARFQERLGLIDIIVAAPATAESYSGAAEDGDTNGGDGSADAPAPAPAPARALAAAAASAGAGGGSSALEPPTPARPADTGDTLAAAAAQVTEQAGLVLGSSQVESPSRDATGVSSMSRSPSGR